MPRHGDERDKNGGGEGFNLLIIPCKLQAASPEQGDRPFYGAPARPVRAPRAICPCGLALSFALVLLAPF